MEPVRTCVGCRSRESRSLLVRVVARGSEPSGYELLVDPSARSPGRGAWVHPALVCFDQASRRRAFGRALRVEGALDSSAARRVFEAFPTEEKAERLVNSNE